MKGFLRPYRVPPGTVTPTVPFGLIALVVIILITVLGEATQGLVPLIAPSLTATATPTSTATPRPTRTPTLGGDA